MPKRYRIAPAHVPVSTYRVQLNHNFTFAQATELAPYLESLGITCLYTSPFLMARPGSLHGYDITRHTELNPEIGSREDFNRLSDALLQRRMTLLADIVPNHMCIDDASNDWWCDVLKNGVSSSFARYFDIDWRPPGAGGRRPTCEGKPWATSGWRVFGCFWPRPLSRRYWWRPAVYCWRIAPSRNRFRQGTTGRLRRS